MNNIHLRYINQVWNMTSCSFEAAFWLHVERRLSFSPAACRTPCLRSPLCSHGAGSSGFSPTRTKIRLPLARKQSSCPNKICSVLLSPANCEGAFRHRVAVLSRPGKTSTPSAGSCDYYICIFFYAIKELHFGIRYTLIILTSLWIVNLKNVN